MVKLKKVGVKSVAKLFGVLYAIFGFIAGLFFGLFSLLALAMGGQAAIFGLLFGIGAIIGFPIFYGIMGAISAFLYNIIAGKIGGIELELSE